MRSDGNGGVIINRGILITAIITIIITCVGATYTFTTELINQDDKTLARIEYKVDNLATTQIVMQTNQTEIKTNQKNLSSRVDKLEAKLDGK